MFRRLAGIIHDLPVEELSEICIEKVKGIINSIINHHKLITYNDGNRSIETEDSMDTT